MCFAFHIWLVALNLIHSNMLNTILKKQNRNPKPYKSWLTERQRMSKGCTITWEKTPKYLGSMKPFSEGKPRSQGKDDTFRTGWWFQIFFYVHPHLWK